MTPEQMASEIANEFAHQTNEYIAMRDDIAAAIRSAVEAEREACAHICDFIGQEIDDQWFGNEDFRRGANRCAHLIRNQLTVASSTQEISPKTPDQGA